MTTSAVAFTTKQEIINGIATAVKSRHEWNALIQSLIVSILCHIHAHKEPSLATKLVNDLAKVTTKTARQAIMNFMVEFGQVSWSNKHQVFKYQKTAKHDLEGMASNFWLDFKPVTKGKECHDITEMEKLAKKLENRLEKALKDPEVAKLTSISEDNVAALYTLVSELKTALKIAA